MKRKLPEYFDLLNRRFYAPMDEFVYDIHLYPAEQKWVTYQDETDNALEPCYLEILNKRDYSFYDTIEVRRRNVSIIFNELQGKVQDETFGIKFKKGSVRLRFENYLDAFAFARAYNTALDQIYGECSPKQGYTTLHTEDEERIGRHYEIDNGYPAYHYACKPTQEQKNASKHMNYFDFNTDTYFNPILGEYSGFSFFVAERSSDLYTLDYKLIFYMLGWTKREEIVDYLRNFGLDVDFNMTDEVLSKQSNIYFRKDERIKFIQALDARMTELYSKPVSNTQTQLS